MEEEVKPVKHEVDETQEIVWDFKIPLLTNPFILLDFAKMLVAIFAVMAVLFMIVGICQSVREFFELLCLIPVFAVCIAGFGVILVFVMLVIYGNRFPCRFTVTRKGVGYEVTKTQKKLNTLVIILGALGGRPGVAGAGFLARAQESDFFAWMDIHRADLFPRRRVVCIRNSWRTLLRIYCTPENYDAVAAIAVDGVKRTADTRRKHIVQGREFRSVMLKRLAWLPLIFISAFLCTAQPLLDERFGPVWITAGVMALGAICAGAARRVLGIIGLFMGIGTTLIIVANGLKVTSYAHGFVRWNGFESATDKDDLLFFIIGCVGLLGLLVLSLRNILTAKEIEEPKGEDNA